MQIIHEPRTIMVESYISEDGVKFQSKDECLQHERKIQREKNPFSLLHVKDLLTYDGDFAAELYYIEKTSDVDSLIVEKNIRRNFDCNFSEHGSGWYIYYCMDGGDGPDFFHLLHYETYEKEYEDEFARWKTKMHQAIAQAEMQNRKGEIEDV